MTSNDATGNDATSNDAWFARWRARELSRLDRAGTTYADYTGAALCPESLVRRDLLRLSNTALGNPHSEHRPSRASTADIERARSATLEFLHAPADEYAVVLTPVALARHRSHSPSLFAFPAQSNFSGVHHPLSLVDEAQRPGWRVLLDAASYLSGSSLDLRRVKPDFVVRSLYKIIGYPTGVGALVVRHDALRMLRRPWFAGGTVQWVSVTHGSHRLAAGVEGFEDGTPSFAAADIVPDALNAAVVADRDRLAQQLADLTCRTLRGLASLRHDNDRPVVRVHGPRDDNARGATIAVSLYDVRGNVIPYWDVEAAARDARVALRGGCFCNPGCAEAAFGLGSPRAAACLETLGDEFSIPRYAACLGNAAAGALRVSYGLGSVQRDVDRVLNFFASYRHAG